MINTYSVVFVKLRLYVYLSVDSKGADNTDRNGDVANNDFTVCAKHLQNKKRKLSRHNKLNLICAAQIF